MKRTPPMIYHEYANMIVNRWTAATQLIYSLREHTMEEVLGVMDDEFRSYFSEFLLDLSTAESDDDLGSIHCPEPNVNLAEIRGWAADIRRCQSGALGGGPK